MRRAFAFAIAALLATDVPAARAAADSVQVHAGSDRTVQRWGIDEGVPNNALTSVLQTRDGYLLIGSWAGLFRFDGVRFTAVNATLPNVRIRCLFEDRDGAVWIGTIGGGVSRWTSSGSVRITARDGLAGDYVTAIAQDSSGAIWIGTTTGLSRITGRASEWRATAVGLAKGVVGLGIGRSGDVFAATADAVYRAAQPAAPFVPITSPPTFTHPITAFLVTKSARLLVGTESSLAEFDVSGAPAGVCANGCLRGDGISSLIESRDGSIWAGAGRNGVARLRESSIMRYEPDLGVPAFSVVGLAEDAEGSIWATPTTGGLVQLRPTRVTTYSMRDGLTTPAVGSITQDRAGNIWAGSSCGPVNELSHDTFTPKFVKELRGACGLVVLGARDGSVWIGTQDDGAFRWDGTTLTAPIARETTNDRRISVLFEDRSGAMWIATPTRLLRFADGIVSSVFAPGDVSGIDIVSLAEDAQGRVWIASNGNGLSVYEHGKTRSMSRDVALPTSNISALIVDSRDDVWIGTADRGLFRYRKGHLERFAREQGLNDTLVALMIEDAAQNIWVSTTRGIARLERSQIEDVASGRIPALTPIVLDRNDGLLETEGMGGGFDPSGLRSRDGRLWFSTVAGIVVIDPATFSFNTVHPSVMIEESFVNGHAVARDALGTLTIPPGSDAVQLNYTASSFLVPARVRFRYRLRGADAEWQEAGGRRVALYSRIRPGDYTFEVMAANNDGLWSETPTTLRVVVLPLFWERRSVQGAFVLLLLVMTGLVANTAAKRRSARRLDTLEREQALDRERTRIARDLHDDLGARLAQIKLIAETQNGGDQLTRIVGAAGEAMQTMDELVWTVDARRDTLENLASYISEFTEEHLALAGLRLRLRIDDDLGNVELHADTRRHVFLAFKEALHNVVKHAAATEVHVSIARRDDVLTIAIQDNGRGVPVSADEGAAGGQLGNGLRNMRDRLAAIGGAVRIESSAENGTTVEFLVPLPSARIRR